VQTYLMIGAGGTGSHLIGPILPYLESHHRSPNPNVDNEWQFVVIDGDNYEAGNLERQLFTPSFVGMNKAESMADMYNRYPIRAVPRFIGREDLQTMMNDGDVVLICADNHSIRALVQERALELANATIINAGNEMIDGTVQLFVRRDGVNETPPITFLHPEIQYIGEEDRAPMSCQQVAALPGGGQLILANAAAAMHMMEALYRLHYAPSIPLNWTEINFDLAEGTVHHIDMRPRRGWTP
jgi:molybdopterin/thiamine biosynthesis adenylyltransferase